MCVDHTWSRIGSGITLGKKSTSSLTLVTRQLKMQNEGSGWYSETRGYASREQWEQHLEHIFDSYERSMFFPCRTLSEGWIFSCPDLELAQVGSMDLLDAENSKSIRSLRVLFLVRCRLCAAKLGILCEWPSSVYEIMLVRSCSHANWKSNSCFRKFWYGAVDLRPDYISQCLQLVHIRKLSEFSGILCSFKLQGRGYQHRHCYSRTLAAYLSVVLNESL